MVYGEAIVANHILSPQSRVDAILAEAGISPPGSDGMTSSWNLDVMLEHGARSIASDTEEILANHGYQSDIAGADGNFTGVNWGYTGARRSDKLDPTVVPVSPLLFVSAALLCPGASLFGAMDIIIPGLSRRAAQRYSVVERLRQEQENSAPEPRPLRCAVLFFLDLPAGQAPRMP